MQVDKIYIYILRCTLSRYRRKHRLKCILMAINFENTKIQQQQKEVQNPCENFRLLRKKTRLTIESYLLAVLRFVLVLFISCIRHRKETGNVLTKNFPSSPVVHDTFPISRFSLLFFIKYQRLLF